MDKTGIMQWLTKMGHENDVERIIDNAVKCIDIHLRFNMKYSVL